MKMATIEDFIGHAVDKDYAKAGETFNDLMADKMQAALDQEKIKVGGIIYNGLNPEDFDTKGDSAMMIPAYELFDFGASYKLSIAKENIYVRLNVNNIFDNHYISESSTNIVAGPGDPTYLGVHTGNRAFPGWGRSWNLGFTYRF